MASPKNHTQLARKMVGALQQRDALLCSGAVLPVRMLMTSVPWWEQVLAVLLLAGASWTFRLAAGKIFALGILLHGKEPKWGEIWRWARAMP